MAKYKLEYLWLDGYEPVANIRGKTQIKELKSFPKVEELPWWGFDGSSTRQAEGRSSDCMLKPVAVYPDSTKKNGVLVMCEVLNADFSVHPTNTRARAVAAAVPEGCSLILNIGTTVEEVARALIHHRGLRVPDDVSLIVRDSDHLYEETLSHYRFEGETFAHRLTRLMSQLVNQGHLSPEPNLIFPRYVSCGTAQRPASAT